MGERNAPPDDRPLDPTFADGAEMEFLKAIARYSRWRSGLGARFLAAVEQTVARATAAPESGVVLGGTIRRRLVPGFPYQVIYRADAVPLRVLAVAHLRRRPNYWRGRR